MLLLGRLKMTNTLDSYKVINEFYDEIMQDIRKAYESLTDSEFKEANHRMMKIGDFNERQT